MYTSIFMYFLHQYNRYLKFKGSVEAYPTEVNPIEVYPIEARSKDKVGDRARGPHPSPREVYSFVVQPSTRIYCILYIHMLLS
jgi:hypothetical protein